RIKFPRRTSFKGRRMIYVPSSNGSADEQERRSFAKLIWKVQLSTLLKLCKADLEGPAFNQVESERDYDINAAYGITHWWFRRKRFYINQHSEPSDREAVRSQMQILSVIRFKTFEKYGYNYLSEIILRRADYKEYKISEKDFKNLHPNDFEDLFRSDGTLTRVMEKLDHMVKDFHLFEYNKGMETRKWSEDDKRRSKDFITAIEKRLH
ncbi:hypothetical protein Tco_0640319, partial [Tanacetum coccineum]